METEKQTLEIFRRLNLNYQRQALVVLSTLLFCQDSQKSSSPPVEPSVAVPETSVEPVAVPETSSVAPERPVAPYRFVLNVPEINDYKD